MLINNKDISIFGCSLVKYEVSAGEIDRNIEWVKGSLVPYISFENNKFKDLIITLLLQGSSREQVEIYKSQLAKEVKIAEIKFNDSKFIYDGVSEPIKFSNINRLAIEVEINFKALQQEELKTVNLAKNATQTITIEGNTSTEAIIDITASESVGEFKINDIIINGISKGQNAIIDGFRKTITIDGKNKFADCELWSFPVFEAGVNTVTMSEFNNVDVKVKYKPTWE